MHRLALGYCCGPSFQVKLEGEGELAKSSLVFLSKMPPDAQTTASQDKS